MTLGIARKRALTCAPLMLVAASCVPSAGVRVAAASAIAPTAAPVAAPAPGFASVPKWAQLDPGMPYKVLQRAVAPAAPFAAGPQAEEDYTRSLDCLAKAIYYEARSESEDGQRAVAQVVLNRVRHPAYPNSICGVVFQGAQLRTGCQFTFTCDGSLNSGAYGPSWDRARRIAVEAMNGETYAPVGTATHYHTTAILPYWANSLTRLAVVGAHVFYRWRGNDGAPSAFTQRYAGVEPAPELAAQRYEPVPTALAANFEMDSGVRRWRAATPEVRIHRGSSAIPAAAAPEPQVEQIASAEPAPDTGFGVQVHRGDAGVPTS